MTLKDCLEIGLDCGLDFIDEALLNINLHAINIFNYSDITEELESLNLQADNLYSTTNFTKDSTIKSVLNWLAVKNNTNDTI